ncbi:hypothetical protein A4G16_02030 [Mannheimia granulomatis]|uniref:Autotransporter adhesin n=1 Tax=Mannheimia granulomatis TaxID=85402 RepID=A0A6G8JGN3_9PAST|nr:YadA-like family protein [Mannheimia granulomatis]QIM66236.1 hypothetical protein A4G16_02030 [Mannheimia granulomatis]
MNKIYKVIFNKSTGTFTAVSEFAKAEGKSSAATIGLVDNPIMGNSYLSKVYSLVGAALGTALLNMPIVVGTAMLPVSEAVAVACTINSGSAPVSNQITSLACGPGATTASLPNAVAVGASATVTSEGGVSVGQGTNSGAQSVAVGKAANAASAYSVVIGTEAKANTTGTNQGVAIGYKTNASGDQSTALGANVIASGASSVAIGGDDLDSASKYMTNADGVSGSAGTGAINSGSLNTKFKEISGHDLVDMTTPAQYIATQSSGQASVAVGVQARSSGHLATAFGTSAEASGLASTALGVAAKSTGYGALSAAPGALASGETSIALGAASQATKINSVAISEKAKATGDNAIAIGQLSNATNTNATALGSAANVTEENASAIGAGAQATLSNSVALGSGSTTATNATKEDNATVNGITYANFKGDENVAVGDQVSVGYAGQERQIKHVAPGAINATSTDAINGSQLYATQNILGNLANSVKTEFGGNALLNPNTGAITFSNIGNTGKDTIHDAIAAVKENVVAGSNVVVTPVTAANGSTTYTVHAKDTTANHSRASAGFLTVTAQPQANNVTNYETALTTRAVTALEKAETAVQQFTTAVKGATVDTINQQNTVINFVDGVGTTATIKDNDITFDVNKGGLTTDTAGNVTSNKAGDNFVTGDDVAKAINEAAARTEKNTTVVAGKNTHVQNKVDGNNTEYTVSADKSTVSVSSALTKTETSTTDATIGAVTTDYALDLSQTTKDEIKKGVDAKDIVDNKGLTFTGDSGSTDVKKLGSTVAVNGDDNITTEATADAINIKLNKDITVNSVTANTVKAGDTTINNDGVTINNGTAGNSVTLTKDGLNNGGNQIMNVASGGDVNTNAANIGDVKNARTVVTSNNNSVKIVKTTNGLQDTYDLSVDTTVPTTTLTTNKGVVETPTNGDSFVTATNLATTINSAVASAKEKVEAGTNIVSVTSETDQTTGATTYTVNAKGTTASAGSDKVKVTLTEKAGNITDYVVDLSDAAKDSLNKADTAVQNFKVAVNDNGNVKTVSNGGTVKFVNGTGTTAKAVGEDVTFDVNFDDSTLEIKDGKLNVKADALAKPQNYFHVNDTNSEQVGNASNLDNVDGIGGAKGINALAAGVNAQAIKQGDLAMGSNASADGTDTNPAPGTISGSALAIGTNAKARGIASTALGEEANAAKNGTLALGSKAQATESGAVAVGRGAVSSGESAAALGAAATATGKYSIASGVQSNAKGTQSIALGRSAVAGDTTATDAIAIGSEANALFTNSIAIGTSTKVDVDNGVALGSNSVATTDKGVEGTNPLNAVIADKTSSVWTSTAAAVSVGDVGNDVTRQITSVAAGTEDTDAVNVAQLKATAQAAKTEVKAGKNVTVTSEKDNTDGHTIYTVNAKDTTVSVAAYSAKYVTATKQPNAGENTTNYEVALTEDAITDFTKDVSASVTAGSTAVSVEKGTTQNIDGVDVTNYKVDLSDETKEQIAKEESVDTEDDNLSVEQDKLNDTKGKNYKVSLKKNLDLGNTGSVKMGDTTINYGGLKVGDITVTNAPITVNGNTVNNINDAINQTAAQAFSPLSFSGDTGTKFDRKLGTEVKVVGGSTAAATDSNIVVDANGTDTLAIKLVKDLTDINSIVINDGPTINGNGIDMNGDKITNLADGENDSDAVNVKQLKASKEVVKSDDKSVTVKTTQNADGANVFDLSIKRATIDDDRDDAVYPNAILADFDGSLEAPLEDEDKKAFVDAETLVKAVNSAGWKAKSGGNKAAGDDAKAELIKPSDEVEFAAGTNLKVKRVGKIFTYETADDVTFNSVTSNNVTVKEGGNLTVGGNSTVDMGGNKITNVEAGEAPTDAVNVSQLTEKTNAAKTEVTGTGLANVTQKAGDNGQTIYNVDVAKADAPTVTRGNVTVKDGDENKVMTASDVAKAITDSEKTSSVKAGSKAVKVTTGEEDAKGNTEYTVDVETDKSIARDDDGKLTVNTDNLTIVKDPDTGAVKANTTTLTNTPEGKVTEPTGDDAKKLVNAGDIANAINNSGFTLKTSATEGEKLSGDNEFINPGDSVEMIAGKNLTVKQEADGKVTYATKADVEFNSIDMSNGTPNQTGKITNLSSSVADKAPVADPKAPTIAEQKAIAEAVKNATGDSLTNAVNLGDLQAATNAAKTKVEAGKGVTVTSETNEDGSTTYTVAAKTDGTTIKVDDAGNITANTSDLGNNTDGTVKAPTQPNALVTAQTVADAINNAGFNIQANGDTKSLVKTGDTVQFLNGKNIEITRNGNDITVATASDVDFDKVTVGPVTIDKTDGIDAGDTKITGVKAGEADTDAVNVSQLKTEVAAAKENVVSSDGSINVDRTVNPDGSTDFDVTVNTDDVTIVKDPTTGAIKANTTTLNDADKDGKVDAPQGDDAKKLVNAGDIANAINNSGWKLAADGTDGNELINPSDTITFKVGSENITVKREGADITYDLAKDINVDSVTSNTITVPTDENNPANNPITINKDGINVGNKTISNVASNLKPVTADDKTQPSANNPADLANKLNNAATVSDVLNAGWNLQGNGKAVDTVTHNDTVDFVDGKGTKVTVENKDGKNTIKVNSAVEFVNTDPNDSSTPSSTAKLTGDAPVQLGNVASGVRNQDGTTPAGKDRANAISNASGDTLNNAVNVGDLQAATKAATTKVEQGDNIVVTPTTNLDGSTTYKVATAKDLVVDSVKAGDTTVNNDGVKVGDISVTNAPITVDGNTVNNVNEAINQTAAQAFKPLTFAGDSGTNVERRLGTTVNVKGGVTDSAKLSDNNIGVVANGTDTLEVKLAKDIKGIDSIAVNNGPTINDDGINMNGDKITNVGNGDISPNSQDAVNGSQLNNYTKVNGNNIGTDNGAINIVNGAGTTVTSDKSGEVRVNVNNTDLTVADNGTINVQDPNGTGAHYVNATTVAKAVNNVSWNVGSGKDEATANTATKNTYTAGSNKVKAGDTVKVNAGRNVEISGSGKNINVAVSDNPEFNTVKVGKGNNATTISSDADGVRIAKADGSPQRITNVAAGRADTDAVNVGQLKGAVGDLNNKINRNQREARAGIAGAAAIAGLPEIHLAGKSMLATAASTYKGENAIAVGYSRLSDNSKIKLKLSGSADTRGDFIGTVGVGYAW